MRLTVEVAGIEKALGVARKVRDLGADMTPLLDIAGGVLESSMRSRFDRGVGPGDIPWPISQRVLRAVGKTGPNRVAGGQTMKDTGELENSLGYEVRPGEVEVGSIGLQQKGKIANQFGSDRASVVGFHTRVITSAFGVPLPEPRTEYVSSHVRINNLPARPWVGVDDNDRTDLYDGWLGYLETLLDG